MKIIFGIELFFVLFRFFKPKKFRRVIIVLHYVALSGLTYTQTLFGSILVPPLCGNVIKLRISTFRVHYSIFFILSNLMAVKLRLLFCIRETPALRMLTLELEFQYINKVESKYQEKFDEFGETSGSCDFQGATVWETEIVNLICLRRLQAFIIGGR
ncbi:MAG: hypothetical protein ACT6FF_08790 [Methanosarcinaceae archaeon]